MKTSKIILALYMLLITSLVNAQIQIESSGQTDTNVEINKKASYIRWMEDGYYFRIADYEASKYGLSGENFIISIYLGQNQTEIQQSSEILMNWFGNAKNDAYIYITNKNGQKVCLYKYHANLYASYGTEVHCKTTRLQYGIDMASALAGVPYKTKDGREKLMANIEFGDYVLTGCCSFKKEFLKSIKNFNE